jgi:hypothetical protein
MKQLRRVDGTAGNGEHLLDRRAQVWMTLRKLSLVFALEIFDRGVGTSLSRAGCKVVNCLAIVGDDNLQHAWEGRYVVHNPLAARRHLPHTLNCGL